LQKWILDDLKQDVWKNDKLIVEWLEKSDGKISAFLAEIEKKKAKDTILELFEKDFESSVDGLAKFLEKSGKRADLLKLLK